MSEPTVIANQAHLPGLRMPGDYEVEFDPESGYVTVVEGPEAGRTFLPDPLVVESMRRALDPDEPDVINESIQSYEATADTTPDTTSDTTSQSSLDGPPRA